MILIFNDIGVYNQSGVYSQSATSSTVSPTHINTHVISYKYPPNIVILT